MTLFDRIVATTLALALLAFGLVVAAEVVHTALGFGGHLVFPWQQLARFGRRHSWDSARIRGISGVVAGVGFLLLVAELRRRRPGLLALSAEEDRTSAVTGRRDLRRALTAQALATDGVSSAHTRLRRRRARVSATTHWRDPGDLRDRLTGRLSDWLDEVDLAHPLRLKIRLKHKAD